MTGQVHITASHVIIDNAWIWRADHTLGGGVKDSKNPGQNVCIGLRANTDRDAFPSFLHFLRWLTVVSTVGTCGEGRSCNNVRTVRRAFSSRQHAVVGGARGDVSICIAARTRCTYSTREQLGKRLPVAVAHLKLTCG